MVSGAEQYPRGVSPRRKHCCAMAAGEDCPRAGVAAIAQSESRARNKRTELCMVTRRTRNPTTFVIGVKRKFPKGAGFGWFEETRVFQSCPGRQLGSLRVDPSGLGSRRLGSG